MATLTVQLESALVGAPTSVAASAGGDQWKNAGADVLYVSNSGGADVTVTVAGQGRCKHGFLDSQAIVAKAGEVTKTRPFPAYRFNDSNGNAQITYSAVTGVSIAVVRQEAYKG